MICSQLLKNALTSALLLTAVTGFAQKHGSAPWKKTVVRVIDLNEPEKEKKHHLTEVGSNTNLAEIMINQILAGQVAAYSNDDVNFTHKLSVKDLKEALGLEPDSVRIVDPVTGTERIRVTTHDVNYDIMHKFRLLEEWTFNPSTGKTDIQITGIAPIKEIYADNGQFRGVQVVFWLRYSDAQAAISRYDLTHPTGSFAAHIWDDYFLSDVKPSKVK